MSGQLSPGLPEALDSDSNRYSFWIWLITQSAKPDLPCGCAFLGSTNLHRACAQQPASLGIGLLVGGTASDLQITALAIEVVPGTLAAIQLLYDQRQPLGLAAVFSFWHN
jgi:hypothetical protein